MSRGTPIDTVYELVTPEHVRFRFRLAGPVSRAWAYAIDLLLKTTVIAVLTMSTSVTGTAFWAVVLLAMFVSEWLYFIVFEMFWNGQTPGKRLLRLRVISRDGMPLKHRQVLLRNLLRPADQAPFLYAFGATVCVLTDANQRLGDLAAGTMVVFEDDVKTPDMPLATDNLVAGLARGPAPGALSDPDLRQAIYLYMAKRHDLPDALREEIMRPLLEKLTGSESTDEVDGDQLLCAYYQDMMSFEP